MKTQLKETTKFISATETIALFNELITDLKIVRTRFPDVEVAEVHEISTESKVENFYLQAESIKYEPDISMDLWGLYWYHLDLTPKYVLKIGEIHYPIYGKPTRIPIWDIPKDLYKSENPSVRWNFFDEFLIENGFDSKYIKPLYKEIIKRLQEPTNPRLKNLPVSISNKEDMPPYIKNKLLLL